jgi:FkbM family methyltransferase
MELDDLLVCPLDRRSLGRDGDELQCPGGHTYPVVQGLPVLLPPAQSDALLNTQWRHIENVRTGVDAVDIEPSPAGTIDPGVQRWVTGSCGTLYRPLTGRLPRYPIPHLDVPASSGGWFLDIGANWGRWSLAAARLGYRVVAVEPSLHYAAMGVRVAAQHRLPIHYVIGDARRLPIADRVCDVAFSYSVLQHFPKDDVRSAVQEIARVVRRPGLVKVQMANRFGPRQLYNQAGALSRRERGVFDIRHWTPRELEDLFSVVGAPRITIDGFFSLNAQISDVDLLPWRQALVTRASRQLTRVGRHFRALRYVADSVYVTVET